MMKKLQISILIFALGCFGMNAQMQEAGPVNPNVNTPDNALFDLLYTIDIGANGSVGANGLAGVAYVNNQYWVSEWQTDQIHILTPQGTLDQSISIAGISGTRSLTTDGTNIFIGTAGSQIFEVDPGTASVVSTINISTTSDATARMVTYDETLDGGNGGFWIGNFGSDIASVDMSGDELSVIPAATHGTVIYGGAFDNVSADGPWLWIHDQSGAAPSRDFITQIDPATGLQTGVQYDFTADGGTAGATEVLAGGLFISDDVDPNATALVGLCQCTPSNLIFGIELVAQLGTDENTLENFTLFPNPANGSTVNIQTSTAGEKQVVVMDVLGKTVIQTVVDRELDISGLAAGVYMVQVTQNNKSAVQKLVVR